MKELEYEKLEDDMHVLHLWEPLNFEIDDDYKYICQGALFNLFSNLFTYIISPVLYLFNKIVFGFKIEGKEKLDFVKSGKITVSNHIHPMDCTMNGLIHFPCRVYFPTLATNFKIPIVRHLIRFLYAIPIPYKISHKEKFLNEIDEALKKNKSIHIYPEGSLWPYCEKLRNFKSGAFKMAVKSNVPIVPIVYVFKEPYGIYKLFKKKKCIHAIVLDPLYQNLDLPLWKRADDLAKRAYDAMSLCLNKK